MDHEWKDHEKVLLLTVHALLRSTRRCKHKLRNKDTGDEYVCEAPALHRKRLSPGHSQFACRACLAIHSPDEGMLPSPFYGEMLRLVGAIQEWESGFDNDLYFASIQLLSKMHHTFDAVNGCPVCTWFNEPGCPAALAALSDACRKYADAEGLDPPDLSFIVDNLHQALQEMGQISS